MKKVIRLTESELIRVVKTIVKEQNETAEADNVLKNVDVAAYCSSSGVPPYVTKVLNALPENKREEAKQFIKTFANAISNKSVRELLTIRKQIKAEKQKAESSGSGSTVNVTEQLAPIVIAGTTISASLLIGIGLLLLFLIVFIIISKSSKKTGGCGGPGWWNDL